LEFFFCKAGAERLLFFQTFSLKNFHRISPAFKHQPQYYMAWPKLSKVSLEQVLIKLELPLILPSTWGLLGNQSFNDSLDELYDTLVIRSIF